MLSIQPSTIASSVVSSPPENTVFDLRLIFRCYPPSYFLPAPLTLKFNRPPLLDQRGRWIAQLCTSSTGSQSNVSKASCNSSGSRTTGQDSLCTSSIAAGSNDPTSPAN